MQKVLLFAIFIFSRFDNNIMKMRMLSTYL